MAILPNLAPMRIYWHAPAPLFEARVNMPGTVQYPVQDIIYDGVTTGAYTDLAADQFFTLGSAAGLDDYGRGRLRAAPTSTVLKVNRSSQGYEDGELSIVDNAHIAVYADYRVHSKIATIINYVEYKDSDIPVGDLTQEPPPVAVMGPDRARRIDADTEVARLFFSAANSYAVADGATIASVAWDMDDGTFVLTTTATDEEIYVDFPAGVRYVSLTVTDSNGKTHTGRRLVLADDPADSLCVSGMQVTNLTRTMVGTVARLRVLQDLPRADFPDGAKVLVWEDRDPAIFGTPDPTDWSDVLFTGWHQVDEASSTAQETHLRRETELTCVDVAGRLDSLPGFNQRLEKPDDDGVWTWGEMDAPNMDKFLHYLAHWHSTAPSVTDFFTSGTWTDYPFVLFDAVGDTLFNQLSRQAKRIVPDHEFTSDRYGRLRVTVNPQLQDPADRTATVQNSITEQGWSAIEFGYQRPPRIHTLRGSAVLTGTDYELDGEGDPIIETAFCIAPGTAPGQGGRESTLGERLAQSQDDLNSCIGHHYARLNARYGDINVTLNANADPWDFDPAALTWVQLLTSADSAPQRGLDFDTIRCLCKEVSIDYTYGEEATTWRGRVVLEPETVGLPALTEEQEEALPIGTQPVPTTPPDFGLTPTQEALAAIDEDGTLYRTADFQTASGSGGPTWTQHDLGITDNKVYSFVVDPFSPGYINGSGTVDGWVVTESDIYRVADMFGTPTATSIHTFATAIDHTDPRQTRTIQASFGRYFAEGVNPWLLVISHYAGTSGHTGTWALRSVDGGANWFGETLVSSHYDVFNVGSDPPSEVGVYASPKTPGYAITTAYVNTMHPPIAAEYYSEDWGETWTQKAGTENPAEPLPILFIFDETGGGLNYWTLGTKIYFTVFAKKSVDQDSGLFTLNLGGPADAVRMNVTGSHVNLIIEGSGSTKATDHSNDFGGTRFVLDSSTRAFVEGGSQSGWTQVISRFATRDHWDHGRQEFEAEFPIANGNDFFQYDMRVTAGGFSGSFDTMNILSCQLEITEIELEDSTVYTPTPIGYLMEPGNRLAGALHVPWEDNDDELVVYSSQFRLFGEHAYRTIQAEGDNSTLDDVSPSDYGPIRSGFGIRAYDSDRTYMVMGAAENDGSLTLSDTLHSVFVSSDGGETWASILGATAESSFTGKRGYSAAFSGTDRNAIYIFGAPSGVAGCISFTSNFGSSVDSRTGNLGSFGISSFLGIVGGPSGS